jgi:cytochrome c
MGNGAKPDVKAVACMKDCAVGPKVTSFLPDFARNAHGNLAEQNRTVGAQRGVDTTQAPAANAVQARQMASLAPAKTSVAAPSANAAAMALSQKHTCTACHGMDNKIVGPGFKEVAKKYAERPDAVGYLAGKIRAGGSGLWGSIPMPAQGLSDADAQTIAKWLAAGANK